jgi:hypothetical protein
MTGGSEKPNPSGDRSSYPSIPRLIVLALLPLFVLLLLRATNVPLGQPFFLIYRYSPIPLLRVESLLIAIPIAAIGLWCLARSLSSMNALKCAPMLVAIVAYGSFIVWTFFAPPNYAAQRLFDLQSPSHDGAFVLESRHVTDIHDYVSDTFYERLQQSPEEMRGRRVISNPAGMTVVFRIAQNIVAAQPGLRSFLINQFDLAEVEDPAQRTEFASAMLVAFLMTLLWGASIVAAFALCRLWLPALPSIAIALACVLNPATLNFAPGKDTAQLFFVILIIYGWFAAYTKGRSLCAVLSGVVAVVAMSIGLIHAWVLLIVVAATLWDAVRARRLSAWMVSTCIPFSIAAVATLAIFSLAFDWNIARMTLAVGMRYRQMQVPIITDPFYWTLVGFPLFLLFVGPMVYAMVGGMRRDMRDDVSAFGGRLLVCTMGVLLFTYFFGNNNETPRLWIPFIPLLILPLSLRRSTFRTDNAKSRVVLLLLIGLQIGVTLIHWSVMDVRETEYRLVTGRMWD